LSHSCWHRGADVIISNHALEHTLHPLQELEALLPKLKPGGKVVFVVPCESIARKHKPDDIITSIPGAH